MVWKREERKGQKGQKKKKALKAKDTGQFYCWSIFVQSFMAASDKLIKHVWGKN